MKKVFLSLITIFMVLSLSVVLVKAEGETTVSLVDGVQIRTDGNNGLRWEAVVNNPKDGYNYGFVYALGDLDALDCETPEALAKEIDTLNDDGTYAITITKFPKAAATKDISMRAYATDGVNIIYSDNIVVRNLAEVAVYAKNSVDGDFVNAVVEYVDANYKKAGFDFFGNYSLSNATIDMSPDTLEAEFIKDWNAEFGTSWTDLSYSTFQSSASKGLSTNNDTNVTPSNAYKFFNTNVEMSAKWGWLIKLIAELGVGYTHPAVQANAILSADGEAGRGTYKLIHFSASIYNFFNGTHETGGYSAVPFTSKSQYDKMSSEKGTTPSFVLYANLTNYKLVKIGSASLLPNAQTPKTGYEWSGWNNGVENLAANSSFDVTSEDTSFTPKFSPITYTITYMDGEETIETLSATYNIESALITLPAYNKDGYVFEGWYENDQYEGEPVTVLSKGSYGDKVYFAKTTKIVGYTINLEYNGGNTRYNSREALIADLITDFNKHQTAVKYSLDGTDMSTGNYAEISTWGNFFGTSAYALKYEWLLEYMQDLAKNDTSTGSDTKSNILKVVAGVKTSGDLQYALSYQVRSFILKTQLRAGSVWAGSNFTLESAYNGFWTKLNSLEDTILLNNSGTVTLPSNVYKPGYVFGGWYTSSDFSGERVYEVSETTTVYAKWNVANVEVNVKYDANGGQFSLLYDSKVKTLYTYDNKSYCDVATEPYLCDTNVANALTWQYYVALNYDETLNAYEVVLLRSSSTSIKSACAAAGVTWTHAISCTDNITTQFKVGQYIIFDGTPSVGDTNISYVVVDDVNAYKYPTIINTKLKDACTLPTPVMEGYKFVGWKSSVDGNVVTEFPGYLTNPGDITYTAQWEAVAE